MRLFQIMFATAIVTLLLLVLLASPARSEVSTSEADKCVNFAVAAEMMAEIRDAGLTPPNAYMLVLKDGAPPHIIVPLITIAYQLFPQLSPPQINNIVLNKCLTELGEPT